MLTITNLHAAYGPIEVLKGINLTVPDGKLVTLIGANGAGKTTTLHAISGLLHPTRGTIEFMGASIGGEYPEQIVRRGVVQVPEGRKVFRNLTVLENLQMGGLSRRDRKAIKQDIDEQLVLFPRLKDRRRQLAGTLSGGEQQMLAFGRALVARPRLLLLDEPSMGLAPLVVDEIAKLITEICKRGVTVLLVEQNAELALSIADYGYVLETGQIAFADEASNLLRNDRVRRSYLGM